MKCRTVILPLVMVALAMVMPAYGDYGITDLGLNPDSHAVGAPSLGSMIGWEFEIAPGNTVTVTGLGIYDVSGDGLSQAGGYQVGIWQVGGGDPLQGSAVVPTGTGGSLVNGFRYVNLPSNSYMTLSPGLYRVAGLYEGGGGADSYLQDTAAVATGAGVNFVGGVISAPAFAFEYPEASTSTGNKWFGPNFIFNSESGPIVPEPSTFVLAAIGLGLAVVLRRKR